MTWQFLQMLPLASDLEEKQIREQLILDLLNSEGEQSVFDTFLKIAVLTVCISTSTSSSIYLVILSQCHVCSFLIFNPDFPKYTCNKKHRHSPRGVVVA